MATCGSRTAGGSEVEAEGLAEPLRNVQAPSSHATVALLDEERCAWAVSSGAVLRHSLDAAAHGDAVHRSVAFGDRLEAEERFSERMEELAREDGRALEVRTGLKSWPGSGVHALWG